MLAPLVAGKSGRMTRIVAGIMHHFDMRKPDEKYKNATQEHRNYGCGFIASKNCRCSSVFSNGAIHKKPRCVRMIHITAN